MDYTHFTAEDLAAEDSFQEFVLGVKGESADFWNSWISQHPEKLQEVELARKIVLSLQFIHKDVEAKKQIDLSQLQLKLFKHDMEDIGRESQRRESKGLLVYKYAASLIFIVSALFAVAYFADTSFSSETTTPEPALVEKVIPRGQKQTIQLLDGTVVKLNSDSKLLYEEDLDKNTREVFLTGEAFFNVAHDAERPFIVHCGVVQTVVLGTEFNVRSYPGEGKVIVALVRGKVEIRNRELSSENTLQLAPNEMVSIAPRQGGAFQVTSFNLREITGWKDGILYFNEADFDEIVRKLEQWYDVQIQVTGDFHGRAFSGEFENQSLESVLNGIGFSLHFRYDIRGREIKIQGNV